MASETEGLCSKYEVIGSREAAAGRGRCARGVSDSQTLRGNISQQAPKRRRGTRSWRDLAWLGEKDAAIAEAKRATELLPESADAFDGPEITEALAEVYAIVGEQDNAIDLLDGLLSRPSPITVALLKIIPLWDPLRGNPRFIELLKKYGGSA